MAEKRKLTVESTYCKDWTVQDALRELLQNAIDTGTKVDILQMGNLFEIKDYGDGISLSDFLIGRSSKQDDAGVIGQFGEGAPIGCLVLARAGRNVKVYSKGKSFAFSFEHDDQWDSQLLTITINELATDVGTSVRVECSAEEMEATKALFIKLCPREILARSKRCDFLEEAGSIFVNGLLVSNVVSLFGYNFPHAKHLVNRDRNAIGHGAIVNTITDALAYTTCKDVIRKILTEGSTSIGIKSAIELNNEFYTAYPYVWKAEIKDLWGDMVCLADNSPHDQLAQEANWKVLVLPWGLRNSLRHILPNSTEVYNKGNKKEYIPKKSLRAELLDFLKEGKEISDWLAKEVGLHIYPVRVFKDTRREQGTMDFSVFGSFVKKSNPQGGEVELEIRLLEKGDMSKLIGTTLHEYTHGTTGGCDNTRSFENDLTTVIATLGTKCFTQAQKIEALEKRRINI